MGKVLQLYKNGNFFDNINENTIKGGKVLGCHPNTNRSSMREIAFFVS
jgi:hypothetical protein